jgi:(p)ppGpp synthase/HD superfamily hydrolase
MNTVGPVDKALQFAAQCHAGTLRDGPDPLPYLTHVVEVVNNLRFVGSVSDPILLTAAALHDLLEQEAATESEIKKLFGAPVLALVQELTRTEPGAEETAGLSKDEIWHFRAQLLQQDIAEMSPAAQVIKLADRLSNVQEAGRVKTGKKLRRYVSATRDILAVIPKERNPGLWKAIRQACDDLSDRD